MKYAYTCLATLILSVLLFACGTKGEKANNTQQQPVDSTTSDALLKELNQKLIKDPNNASLYHDRALYFLNKGTYSKAMDDAVRALSLDSLNPEYLYTKGDIFFSVMRFDDATEAFGKSLKQDPEHIASNIKMAKIMMYMRQYKEAMAHVNRALKADVNLSEGYFLKGVLYQYTGDSAKAQSSFQTAVEQKADYFDAYVTLGLLYASRNDSLAIEYYNSALSLRPNSVEALYDLAMYYQQTGKFEKAFATYNRLLKASPNTESAYHNKGYIYLVYLNQLEPAIQQFDSALKINPRYVDAYHNRGLAYREMKKFKEARADFRTALQLNPQYDLSAEELDDMDKRGER